MKHIEKIAKIVVDRDFYISQLDSSEKLLVMMTLTSFPEESTPELDGIIERYERG
jgi:hypothetical protein